MGHIWTAFAAHDVSSVLANHAVLVPLSWLRVFITFFFIFWSSFRGVHILTIFRARFDRFLIIFTFFRARAFIFRNFRLRYFLAAALKVLYLVTSQSLTGAVKIFRLRLPSWLRWMLLLDWRTGNGLHLFFSCLFLKFLSFSINVLLGNGVKNS